MVSGLRPELVQQSMRTWLPKASTSHSPPSSIIQTQFLLGKSIDKMALYQDMNVALSAHLPELDSVLDPMLTAHLKLP